MKKNKKTTFLLIYYPAVLLFSILSAMLMKYTQTGKALVPTTILAASIIFAICILGTHLTFYFVNKASKLSHLEFNKKIIPGFIIYVVCMFLIANLIISLGVFIWYLINDFDLSNYLHNLFTLELPYANRNLVIWLILFSIVFFYTLWKKSSKKEQSLREENLKFRYQSLKSQVNPHFLFNSFNTLSELIYSDAKKADKYLQKLSSIYRHILENEEKDLIPLEDELNFVRQYFNLQKERDNDKIILSIDIKDPERFKIIPVSLQLLIENALKHNSISYEKPLQIKIIKENDYIVVSNNIQRKNILGNSTGKGLQNLSERVKSILNKELIVIENDCMFIVKLPIKAENESSNN